MTQDRVVGFSPWTKYLDYLLPAYLVLVAEIVQNVKRRYNVTSYMTRNQKNDYWGLKLWDLVIQARRRMYLNSHRVNVTIHLPECSCAMEKQFFQSQNCDCPVPHLFDEVKKLSSSAEHSWSWITTGVVTDKMQSSCSQKVCFRIGRRRARHQEWGSLSFAIRELELRN